MFVCDDVCQGGEDVRIGDFMAYFACAARIEQSYLRPGQPAVWLLLADLAPLRGEAKALFGTKLVSKLGDDATIGHIVNAPPEEKYGAFIAAAGEIWLFSFADFHVISRCVTWHCG
jgi:hypothetical protein